MIGDQDKKMMHGIFSFFNQERPVIFDIGSNKGMWSDLILEEFGEKVDLHLFEPLDRLKDFTEVKYEYRGNIKFNSDAIHCIDDEEKDFYYFDNYNNELSSLFEDKEGWEGLPTKQKKVNTKRIDTYCKENNIEYVDCIKIDVEGNDINVFSGCGQLLEKKNIGLVIIEYGEHYKRATDLGFKWVIGYANGRGYNVYSFDGDNYNEVTLDNFVEDYHPENYIITNKHIQNKTIGWGSEFMKNTSQLGKFDLAVEIGVAEGLTTKYICENLLNDGGRVIAIDPLENYYTISDTEHKDIFIQQYERFIRNTRGLPINLIRNLSILALPDLHALRVDFCYIDGDHDDKMAYIDCVWCHAITRIEGHILMDDYIWKGINAGIDMFLNEFSDSIQVIHTGYQVLIKKTQDQYNDITEQYYK
jgi:FkbM family methyltransferase